MNCHKPIPNCTCVHPWRCGSIRLAKLYRTKDQIIQFLTGLNESFSVVKTQILLMDPLPSINKVYSSVVQEEIHYDVVSTLVTIDESSISINVSDSRKVYPRGKRPTYLMLIARMIQDFAHFATVIITLLSLLPQIMLIKNHKNNKGNSYHNNFTHAPLLQLCLICHIYKSEGDE